MCSLYVSSLSLKKGYVDLYLVVYKLIALSHVLSVSSILGVMAASELKVLLRSRAVQLGNRRDWAPLFSLHEPFVFLTIAVGYSLTVCDSRLSQGFVQGADIFTIQVH